MNVKKIDIGHSLKVHHHRSTLKLSNNYRLQYEFPVEIKLACPLFDFGDYPFDRQVCVLLIGSFRYDAKKNVYMGYLVNKKSKHKLVQNYHVKDLVALSFGSCILNYDHYYLTKDGNINFQTFQHSHFGVKMELKRSLQHFIVSVYLPSILLVLIGWFGFLVHPCNVVGRLALQFTTLIVLLIIR